VGDRSGESGPELLIRRQLGEVADEEHEGAADVFSNPTPRHRVTECGHRRRTCGHEPPLAVQHDHRLRERSDEGLDALFVSYHTFTIHSPSIDPSETAPPR
jgi:hypothetical protein